MLEMQYLKPELRHGVCSYPHEHHASATGTRWYTQLAQPQQGPRKVHKIKQKIARNKIRNILLKKRTEKEQEVIKGRQHL